MKSAGFNLCLLLMSFSLNFAQHTTYTSNQEKEDVNGEILYEMRSISKTLGLYLEKMNSLEEKMKSMEDKINGIENQCSAAINGTPCDCSDILKLGEAESGVYRIFLEGKRYSPVYCDMVTDGGGWLVFQRRVDGSENFYRQWNDYRNGFGDLVNEFWLGNEILHQILSSCGKRYELRIDMGDHSNNKRYAKYSAFKISSEVDNYRLNYGHYSGNAGDSLARNNGNQFTTFDKDNDAHQSNCAVSYRGAWWYSSACGYSNLNGVYNTDVRGYAAFWEAWKGFEYSLRFTEMKIRPN